MPHTSSKAPKTSSTLSPHKEWFQKTKTAIQDDFFTLLRFKSISTDPAHNQDIKQTAQWLSSYINAFGMKSEVWETIGHPVVFAEHIAGKGKPTVMIYAHYDVQPVDPLDLWISPPFEPVVREGEIYARGASDDKGQAFYVVTAMKALFETGEIPDLNIKLFIEGEEECGAKGSVDIMFKKKDEMKADHLLIVDGGLPDKVTPSITLGLRGIMAMQIACRNSHIDLHSGVYGGIALNPNRALVTLLGKLWDEKGRVAVPGFYDDVDEPSKDDLAMFDQTFDKEGMIKTTGLKAFQGEPGYSLWESNMIRPVLEINGVSGGYTGSGFKTVIPKAAFAKLSARLVPNQDPLKVAEKISAFLKQNCPEGLDLEVAWDHGGLPVRSSPKSKVAIASQQAYAEVFGKPCLIHLCGASIPCVPDLVKACGADMACVGVGLSTDNIHAPNEHFGMDRFELGFLTTIKILQNLCTI